MCDKFNTTGKSLLIFRNHVKPRNQKYFAFHVGQINGTSFARLAPARGAYHDRHDTLDAGCGGRFCSGAQARTNEQERTAKSCGPGAAMLALSLQCFLQVTVAKKPAHRGEHEVSRKAIAQGMSDCLRCPVCSCAPKCAFLAHETAGAARTRHSLRPLFSRARFSCKTRAKRAARPRSCVCDP